MGGSNRRKSPVTKVPEIQKLLRDGFKWNGNFHDDIAPKQAEWLLQHYKEVATEQAYDKYGNKVEGELGVWVRGEVVNVDDILDSAVSRAIDEIWSQRDVLINLHSRGIPVDLNISIVLTVDRKFTPLLTIDRNKDKP